MRSGNQRRRSVWSFGLVLVAGVDRRNSWLNPSPQRPSARLAVFRLADICSFETASALTTPPDSLRRKSSRLARAHGLLLHPFASREPCAYLEDLIFLSRRICPELKSFNPASEQRGFNSGLKTKPVDRARFELATSRMPSGRSAADLPAHVGLRCIWLT